MSEYIYDVIVVEDNPHDFLFLEAALEDSSYAFEITHVESLSDCLTWLGHQRFDCMLLDLGLPDGQGLGNVERISAVANYLPIVVLTGLDDDTVAVQAVQMGAQDYLVKGSYSSENIAKTIRYSAERKRTTLALKNSEERFSLVVESSQDGVFDWDLKRDKVFFSENWYKALGLLPKPFFLSSTALFDRVHNEDLPMAKRLFSDQQSDKAKIRSADLRLVHEQGHFIWMRCRFAIKFDLEETAMRFVGSFSDISGFKTKDPLTNLPVRAIMVDRLNMAIAKSKRDTGFIFALIAIRIKNLDDMIPFLGHQNVDRVLAKFGKRLKDISRESDTIARVDGHKFLVFTTDLKAKYETVYLFERLKKSLEEAIAVGEKEVNLKVVGGTVTCPPLVESARQLMDNAELALAQAQHDNVNLKFYDEALQVELNERFELEAELQQAIAKDEFHLNYQPIFEIATKKIVGGEALIRWKNGKFGNVGPFKFIPLAEENGLISSIGEQVLVLAARQMKTWLKKGKFLDWRLNINLSAVQLLDPTLMETIERIFKEHSVPFKNFQFEFTESVLADETKVVANNLAELKRLGAHVALDDFGTGYSSLSYLHQYDFDTLKIDRAFVTNIESMSKNYKIVNSIVNLATSLSVAIVAEGIETEKELKVLDEMGCKKGQGYLVSKPLNAEDFERQFMT